MTDLLGFDRATPPSVAEARAIRQANGGDYWLPYVGGPASAGGAWTPAAVRALMLDGWRMLPVYVGQQDASISSAHQLTDSQGHADGLDALRCLERFGLTTEVPALIVLDVEAATWSRQPQACWAYVRAWCNVVAAGGGIPGVYATPPALTALSGDGVGVRHVVAARWVRSGVDRSVITADIPDLAASLWPDRSRTWQYTGGVRVPGASSPVDVSCSCGWLLGLDGERLIVTRGAVSAPTNPEEPMTRAERFDVGCVLARTAMEQELGRVPSTDEVHAAANDCADHGFEQWLWKLTGSAEAAQHRGVLDDLARLQAGESGEHAG